MFRGRYKSLILHNTFRFHGTTSDLPFVSRTCHIRRRCRSQEFGDIRQTNQQAKPPNKIQVELNCHRSPPVVVNSPSLAQIVVSSRSWLTWKSQDLLGAAFEFLFLLLKVDMVARSVVDGRATESAARPLNCIYYYSSINVRSISPVQ